MHHMPDALVFIVIFFNIPSISYIRFNIRLNIGLLK